MARRKRLKVPLAPNGALGPVGSAVGGAANADITPPPISRVVGESAAEAALAEVVDELGAARSEGRMVVRLPLDAVSAEHLTRDRLRLDPAEMAALEASIEAHGQRHPIEVVETGGAPGQGEYGLISGWRRLAALKALHRRTGDERFATVAALLRRPADAGAAYTAMVEENEIRADLSHWERAAITVRAVEEGVFPDIEAGLAALFGAVSKARRSKIRTFVGLYERLAPILRFGPDLSERLGLKLAASLAKDPDLGARLAAELAAARPESTAGERALIEKTLASQPQSETGKGQPGAGRIALSGGDGRLVLEGPGVTAAFRRRLARWLATQ